MANNAQGMAKGQHPGYEPTALDGLMQSLGVINERRIKVVINGGALNPKGLAVLVDAEVWTSFLSSKLSINFAFRSKKRNYNLLVSWLEGDDLRSRATVLLLSSNALGHLDSDNKEVSVDKNL